MRCTKLIILTIQNVIGFVTVMARRYVNIDISKPRFVYLTTGRLDRLGQKYRFM